MKRGLSNTPEHAVQAMMDAAKEPLQPPEHVKLRKEDEPFWEGVIASRARAEWTKNDLVVASQLARCQRDIEYESQQLQDEGTVVVNARGTQVCNPRCMVLEQLARREMAIMRTLGMSGKLAGDPRKEVSRRRLERDAAQVREQLEDDELLAS